MAPRPQSGDVDRGPAVHRVLLGGMPEWRQIETSFVAQLIEIGASNLQVSQICAVLRRAFFRWRPETVVLINEEDRDVVLPVLEDLVHRERVTVNGLMFEILRREIRGLPAGEGRR